MADFLPRADAGFFQWSRNFQQVVAASYERLGFSAQSAAELTAAWGAFEVSYRRMHDPMTRTAPTAAEKRSARAALEGVMRPMARVARARLLAVELAELGLRPAVRSRARIGPPTSAPLLRLRGMQGTTVRLALVDAARPLRRGKPEGVSAALILFRVGDDEARPVRVRQTTRPRFDLELGGSFEPGTRVRVWACWTNPRGEQGPASGALELRVGYPVLMMAA